MVVDESTRAPDIDTADNARRRPEPAIRVEYLNIVIMCAVIACLPTFWAVFEVATLSAQVGHASEPASLEQAIDLTRTLLACATAVFVWVGFFIILILRRMSATFQVNHTARLRKQAAALRAELAEANSATEKLLEAHLSILAARDQKQDESVHALVGATDKLIEMIHALIETILREGDERAMAAVRQAAGQIDGIVTATRRDIRLVDKNTSPHHRSG